MPYTGVIYGTTRAGDFLIRPEGVSGTPERPFILLNSKQRADLHIGMKVEYHEPKKNYASNIIDNYRPLQEQSEANGRDAMRLDPAAQRALDWLRRG